jgi:cytochrome P450
MVNEVDDLDTGEIPEVLGRLRMADLMVDPYPTLAAFRESAPAVAVENNGYRMWLVTRYEDVRRVLADDTVGRDLIEHRRDINSRCMVRPDQRARLPHGSRRSFFDRDGEHHRRLRGMVGNVFSPAQVAQLRPAVERLVEDLLDGLPVGEPIDLAAEFARPLAGTIICDMLGIPRHGREEFPVLETEMITSPVIGEIEQAARRLYEFAIDMVEVKRERPGDDLYTDLLRMHEQGRMSLDELTSTYILLLVGGMEPSTAIGNGVITLLRHPDELARLVADPDLFGPALEEILRYESPFRLVPPRRAGAALTLDGVTIPAGELILVSLAAANRDPAQYDDPDTFDATRRPHGHLGFGHGPHRCLGATLGRLETETALRRLFARFPATRLAMPDQTPDWRQGKFMRRLGTLPVILDRGPVNDTDRSPTNHADRSPTNHTDPCPVNHTDPCPVNGTQPARSG